ncbi:MAG: LlaMI family restriction endonuclease [Campylobacterota bacterium]|nr:LlaMI family restriction endonuclease [Campylobacterota bacterium]
MDKNKKQIIELFNTNVKGKKPDTSSSNPKHHGKGGHWLEEQMGIIPNGDNAPDILGYEMKNQTTSKTSFGDWQADEYIYIHGRGKNPKRNNTNINYNITRDNFLEIFGKPNMNKNGRYSWSGQPCPKYGNYNDFGQKLIIDSDNNIIALYSFSEDKRSNKFTIIPQNMQIDNLVIAKWNVLSLQKKLENKFNQKGWFKCTMDNNGFYNSIHFGLPMTYDTWINLVKQGIVIFDSGMYQGNARPYAMWRAVNSFWDSLIVESY